MFLAVNSPVLDESGVQTEVQYPEYEENSNKESGGIEFRSRNCSLQLATATMIPVLLRTGMDRLRHYASTDLFERGETSAVALGSPKE